MEKLTPFSSVAAPLLSNNVDTDIIFPARFLLILEKKGLGKYAFSEKRGGLKSDFVLDQAPFDTAKILVAGRNFGIGSSREQAVWALADLGIRCVIARSFGEIFFSNCFKNGVLPIQLDGDEMSAVEAASLAEEEVFVDLSAQHLRLQSGAEIDFSTDPHGKRALLLGLDEIEMVLAEDSDAIEAFEAQREAETPWIVGRADQLANLKK
ncbi:3-isopropylmalate dehydratase small subunit [Pararhizobium sp. IMCC21322]|uniref:3-isopropylmalate dehydratase small subunit n=1 Tax=Pararhizobium sp. IMCC21322 TaxID=3067903 RepID=UPI00274174C4|nr:3-isopropylmalate dehydratase small subunit [Pararhizobium sp. IMCC21322]